MGIGAQLMLIQVVVVMALIAMTAKATERAEEMSDWRARAVFQQLETYSQAASICLNSSSSPLHLTAAGQTASLTVPQIVACGMLGPGWADETSIGTPITMTATLTTAGKPRLSLSTAIPTAWLPYFQDEAAQFDLDSAGISISAEHGAPQAYQPTDAAQSGLGVGGDAASPGYSNQLPFGQ